MTWLQNEEYAYPNGGQTRKGMAIFPDGKTRRVWAGIPDTFFTVPAHCRVKGKYVGGFITYEGEPEQFRFNPYRRYRDIIEGWPYQVEFWDKGEVRV